MAQLKGLMIGIILMVIVLLVFSVIYLSTINNKPIISQGSEKNNIIQSEMQHPQMRYNNVSLIDRTVYGGDGSCYGEFLGMRIEVNPCNVTTYTGFDIESNVNFTWKGVSPLNVTWIFVYDGELTSGSIYNWQNSQYQKQDYDYSDKWINNYLVDKVINYTNLGNPNGLCEIGNSNNTQMYRVNRLSSINQSYNNSAIYCFTDITTINSTAFRISGNINNAEWKTIILNGYHYEDVTSNIKYLGKDLLGSSENRSYYQIQNVQFNPNQTYQTLWRYSPLNKAKSGKWHILGYQTSTGLLNSIQSNQYIYLDPAWNTGNLSNINTGLTRVYYMNDSGEYLYGAYNITQQSGVPTYSTTGQLSGKNLYADGTIYLRSPADDQWKFNDRNISLSFWVNVSTQGGQLISAPVGGSSSFYLGFNGDTSLYWKGCTAEQSTGIGSFITGAWNNIIYVHNDTSSDIWVNGIKRNNCTGAVAYTQQQNILADNAGNSKVTGRIDEWYIWNRTLTTSEIIAINGTTLFYTSPTTTDLTITQSYPASYVNLTQQTVNFGCNYTTIGQNLSIARIKINDQTGTIAKINNITGLNTPSYNATWTINMSADGTFNWTCDGFGSLGVNATTTNRTFTIDSIAPNVIITYPSNTLYNYNVSNITWAVTHPASPESSCWITNNSGVTNYTVTCYANYSNLINATDGTHTWVMYANDSFNNIGSASVTFTVNTLPFIDVITLNSPANNLNTSIDDQTFIWSISESNVNTTNTTLKIWNSSNSLIFNETQFISGNGSTNFNFLNTQVFNLPEGILKWNAEACYNYTTGGSNCTTATSNNTLIIDLSAPIVNITYIDSQSVNYSSGPLFNTTMNYSVFDYSKDKCWYSVYNQTCSQNSPIESTGCGDLSNGNILADIIYNFTIPQIATNKSIFQIRNSTTTKNLLLQGVISPYDCFSNKSVVSINKGVGVTYYCYYNNNYYTMESTNGEIGNIIDDGNLSQKMIWDFRNYLNCNINNTNISNLNYNNYYNITLFANDTYGRNSNYTYYNYRSVAYSAFSSISYTSSTYETKNETIIFNFTIPDSFIYASGVLHYFTFSNGKTTDYNIDINCDGINCNIIKTIDIPLINTPSSANLFNYTIITYDGNASHVINSGLFGHSIYQINMHSCSSTFQSLNFTNYEEKNLTRIYNYSFDSTFNYYLGSGSVYRQYNLTSTASENIICVNNTNTGSVDKMYIDSIIAYGSNNYYTRNFFTQRYLINSTLKNINLYSLLSSDSTSFILKVIDKSTIPLSNVIVNTQRCYPGLNNNYTVFAHKTDSNGLTTGNLEAETALYQFFITNYSNTLLSVIPCSKIVPQTAPYTLTFEVGGGYQSPFIDINNASDITSNIYYNYTTNTAYFTYSDASNNFVGATLLIKDLNASGTSEPVTCVNYNNFSSGIISCNISSDGTYLIQGIINRGTQTLLGSSVVTVSYLYGITGYYGAFLGVLILIICSFAFKYDERAGVWLIFIGCVFNQLLGFISFGYIFLIAQFFVTIILTAVLDR